MTWSLITPEFSRFTKCMTFPLGPFADKCVSVIDKGRYYRGVNSRTANGEECINWDSHEYDVTPRKYPDEGLEKNYCRNPLGSGTKPWCYTKRNKTANNFWGFCDIPACGKMSSSTESCRSYITYVHIQNFSFRKSHSQNFLSLFKLFNISHQNDDI
jgi:hypothetical protein